MTNNLLIDFPTLDQIALDLDHELLKDFATYYEESKFGLELLLEDLEGFKDNLRILEIGSGIGLVSQYLASKGLNVSAMEPVGRGFGMMSMLQNHVSKYFISTNLPFKFYNSTLENFNTIERYDYIFSINVFEHIEDPFVGLKKTHLLLEKGGVARIITPNYALPYEPHFNIPIFINKKITYRIFRSRIETFDCFDPLGLWASLNWISIPKLKKLINLEDWNGTFSLKATHLYFKRLVSDSQFLLRKGSGFRFLALKLRFSLRVLPSRMYPILDLKLTKPGKQKNGKCDENV